MDEWLNYDATCELHASHAILEVNFEVTAQLTYNVLAVYLWNSAGQILLG